MGKRDFHKELGEYLSTRNKSKNFSFKEFISNLFPKKDEIIEVPENVEVYSEDTIIENEKTKEPWIKKIFSLKKEEKEKPDIEYKLLADDTFEDLKVLIKITLEAIKNLPAEKIKEFKKTESFESLKKMLKKHELIK